MDKVLEAPAFVIHLARATERYEFFMTNIHSAGFSNIQIYDAIDGSNSMSIMECYKQLGDRCIFDYELSKGQIGCLLSHLMLWQRIIDENIEICTIFEDDVYFHPLWNTLSKSYFNDTPPDFDIIFIGNGLDSCITQNPSLKINTESSWCTHAYIITRKGAKRMLNAVLNWDYKSFNHSSRGKNITGLYAIDIMIKLLQESIINKLIPEKFIWYCWNGTYFECNNNKLPVTGNDRRNTGLVFQQSDSFKSYVGNNYNGAIYFYDEAENIIDITRHEVTEQYIAKTFIDSDAIVLELGGRYGVVSAAINSKLKNKKAHVVVEPDITVFNALKRNLVINSIPAITYNGTISKNSLFIEYNGLGTITRSDPCSCNSVIIDNKSLSDLIKETGLEFNTLVADCEGCMGMFFKENLDYIPNFKLITLEYDNNEEVDYDIINNIFRKLGYTQAKDGGHSVWVRDTSIKIPQTLIDNIRRQYYSDTIYTSTNTVINTFKKSKLIWNKKI